MYVESNGSTVLVLPSGELIWERRMALNTVQVDQFEHEE